MKNNLLKTISFLGFLSLCPNLYAASFVIGDGQTVTTAQTLDGNGETGVINNGGQLSVSSGNAISIDGQDVTVTNNGAIESTANNSSMESYADNSRIINNGTINSSSTAIGLYDGNDSHLINNGAISGTIYIAGEGAYLVNNGTITSNRANVIFGTSGAQNVTLTKNSRITGGISLSDGQDSVTVTGSNISQRIETAGVENLTTSSNVASVITNDTIHVIDPTSVSALNLGVNNLSLSINDAINSRSSKNNSQKTISWNKAFGSKFERGNQDNNLAFNHDYYGFVSGYEKSGTGFILGISSGKIKTDAQSFKSDVTSIFAGVYKNFEIAKLTTINLNLIGGYEKYENKRDVFDNINGLQTANSDFNNFFFSPSIAIQLRIKFGEMFELVPNASLNYTSSFFGGYKEKSTTASNLKFSSRQVQIFNARAGLKTSAKFKYITAQLGAGLDSRIIDESSVNASISNSSSRFSPNNDRSVNGRYFNFALEVAQIKGFTLSSLIEIRRASTQETQKSGNLNISYKF